MTLRSVQLETQIISYMICCASDIGWQSTASKFGYFLILKGACTLLYKEVFFFTVSPRWIGITEDRNSLHDSKSTQLWQRTGSVFWESTHYCVVRMPVKTTNGQF